MLESDGNAILIAQNTIGGFSTELTDLSGNNKPVSIAFSAELSRAQKSMSVQPADAKKTVAATAEVDVPAQGAVVTTAPNSSGAAVADPQNISGGSTSLLQDLSSTPTTVDELQTTLSGVRIVHAGGDAIGSVPVIKALAGENVSPTTVLDAADVSESLVMKSTPEGDATFNNGIASLRLVEEATPLATNNASNALVAESTEQGLTPKAPISAAVPSLESIKPIIFDEATTTAPANMAVDTAIDPDSLVEGASKIPAKVALDDAVASKAIDIAETIEITEAGSTAQITATQQSAAITGLAVVAGKAAIEDEAEKILTIDTARVGVKEVANKPSADLSKNAESLYKPSPALVKSGLGRISVELNSGATSVTPIVTPTAAAQPSANAALPPSAAIDLGQSPSAVASSTLQLNTARLETVSGHEFLRSVTGAQTMPPNGTPGNANSVAASVANLDETKQGVSLPATATVATSVSATSVSATSISPQSTLVETVIPNANVKAINAESAELTSSSTASLTKGVSTESFTGAHSDGGGTKHSNQQFSQGNGTVIKEDVALTLQREAQAAEQQNKLADVTPVTTRRQVTQLAAKPDIASLSAANASVDTPASNVYHVTSNGIISANSTPLNTTLSGDIATAPKTLVLGQPDADQSLVENVRWAVNEKLTRATINVTPANLGPITVSVDVENQNMNVSILTNSTVAKEAIDSLMPRMREHFTNEGYQQINVDVSAQQERQSNSRDQSEKMLEQGSGPDADLLPKSESVENDNRFNPDQQRVSRSLIDTYV